MWYLGIEIELGIVGLCLEGDGLETGNSNIAFGVGGHQVCHCGLFIVGDGVVLLERGKYSGTGADTWARTPRLTTARIVVAVRHARGCGGRGVHAVSYAKRSRSGPLTAEQLPPHLGG